MRSLGVLLLCGAAAAGCATAPTYGARRALDTPPVPLARALVSSNVGRTIAVEGKVADVCQMKGCWMVLTDGTRTVRTTFKDYGFFVPKDLAGRTFGAEGVLAREADDEETRRHYAGESGPGAAQTAASPCPSDEYTFIASSATAPPQTSIRCAAR